MGNRDLRISGSGSYTGGKFDSVSISGSGKINGDLQCIKFSSSGSSKVEGNIVCERFECSGSSKIGGNITSKEFKCSGSGRITGSVKAEEVRVSGVCKIEGDMQGNTISNSGSTTIDGDIKCEKVAISGMLSSGKNIEAEEISINGAIKNTGTINAERILIECRGGNGSCIFNEIGASKVSINKDTQNIGFSLYKLVGLFTGSTNKISGNLIEGDEIYIENANVKMVRGDKIVIGPDCQIDQVEYRESIEVSDKAQVKQVVKI